MRLNGRVWRLERKLVAEAATGAACPRCHGEKFVTVVFDEATTTACPLCGNPGVRVVVSEYVEDAGAEAGAVPVAA